MYEWALQQQDTVVYYRYDEQVGVLQRNNKSSIIPTPVSGVLGVLLAHADAPVTPEDLFESNIGVQNSRSAKKSIKELKQHPDIGRHILQVGENNQAIYSFLTSPQESALLLQRMEDVHKSIYGIEETDASGNKVITIKHTLESEKYANKIKKASAAAVALASAATVTYAVVRHVRKK